MADPDGFYGVTVPEANGGHVDYVFDVPHGVFVATQSPLPGETDSLRISGKIVNGQVQANRVSYIDANGMETEATEATRRAHPDFDMKMMGVDATSTYIMNAAINNQSVGMPVGALGWTRSQLTAAPGQQPAAVRATPSGHGYYGGMKGTPATPPPAQTDDQIYAQYAQKMQQLGATSTILAPPDLSGMQKRGASPATVGIPYSTPAAQAPVNNGLVPPDGRAQFNQNHGIDVSYSDGTGWKVNVTLGRDRNGTPTFSETATDAQGHKVLSSGSINGQDISVDTLKSAKSGTACPKDPDNIKFDVMRAQATAKAQLGVSVPPPAARVSAAPGH